ncbi:MAG: SUMF1/EgtB/PvdO family nonheme iron enzyme [Candidatus Binatia bacterium]
MMTSPVRLATALGCCLGVAAPTPAAVLCQKKSGAVFVRVACKKKEAAVDLAQFGAVGPQGPPGVGPLTTCPADSVLVGTTCVDKYEASVWSIPAASTSLLARVQQGTVTLADLAGGGATEVSPSSSCTPGFPGTFPANGNWTGPLYAVSVAGVLPTACVTWFQAEQACALSGKRLLTDEEWQRAAAGTPDPGTDDGRTDCDVKSPGPVDTGSRSSCKSAWGVFDMVGNVEELVADWGEQPAGCTNWASSLGDDRTCMGGNGTNNLAGALIRGGYWNDGTDAGVFAVYGFGSPSLAGGGLGFRCAR